MDRGCGASGGRWLWYGCVRYGSRTRCSLVYPSLLALVGVCTAPTTTTTTTHRQCRRAGGLIRSRFSAAALAISRRAWFHAWHRQRRPRDRAGTAALAPFWTLLPRVRSYTVVFRMAWPAMLNTPCWSVHCCRRYIHFRSSGAGRQGPVAQDPAPRGSALAHAVRRRPLVATSVGNCMVMTQILRAVCISWRGGWGGPTVATPRRGMRWAVRRRPNGCSIETRGFFAYTVRLQGVPSCCTIHRSTLRHHVECSA